MYFEKKAFLTDSKGYSIGEVVKPYSNSFRESVAEQRCDDIVRQP